MNAAHARRRPPTAETRAKISASRMGQVNHALWGRARKIGEWEHEVLIREAGRMIRDARLERDVSQEELSEATGISEQTLVRIENGTTRRGRNCGAQIGTIIRIALALGMRPYELMP